MEAGPASRNYKYMRENTGSGTREGRARYMGPPPGVGRSIGGMGVAGPSCCIAQSLSRLRFAPATWHAPCMGRVLVFPGYRAPGRVLRCTMARALHVRPAPPAVFAGIPHSGRAVPHAPVAAPCVLRVPHVRHPVTFPRTPRRGPLVLRRWTPPRSARAASGRPGPLGGDTGDGRWR